ncbi:Formamidopyrimidine-DNA glycosylase [Zancudomyces culisetae]|uniref:Formamidopyrimidine-DNA glycosylase n=1 Tax=Zancudomyces culisetae TaxID=1213189 RepID=A0A1R1PLC0_ZANCU|nr:Formamidopyrimidine-DNA glycosylase [Zancudomyces culisetae]|eukprot:OMH81729.1 Formamidopyrimidine-DNA glycosylase [Zancudomyces culisetae]
MLGRVVERVERYGKYFYVSFKDTGPKLLLHLGMTGDILIENGEPHFYKAPKIKYGQSWPPKYMKFEFSLSSSEHGKPETRISFCDARRLGSIYLISGDPRTTHPIMNLGYDPLVNPPSVDEFVQLVYSKNTQIKAFLLDQHNIAGIGNWIADVDSDDSYYPKSWLFHYRWDKRISKSKNGAPKVEGNRVEYIKVWCYLNQLLRFAFFT